MRIDPQAFSDSRDDLDRVFDGDWAGFEAWVRQAIGGDFDWKIYSRDTPELRQMIIDSIRDARAANSGVFPEANDLLARVRTP